jgi:hypothetical protein
MPKKKKTKNKKQSLFKKHIPLKTNPFQPVCLLMHRQAGLFLLRD